MDELIIRKSRAAGEKLFPDSQTQEIPRSREAAALVRAGRGGAKAAWLQALSD